MTNQVALSSIVKKLRASKNIEMIQFRESNVEDLTNVVAKYVELARWIAYELTDTTNQFIKQYNPVFTKNQGMAVKAANINPFTSMYFPWIITDSHFSIVKNQRTRSEERRVGKECRL